MEKVDCLDKGFVRLVDHMGDDSSIVQMARVSYGKGTKKLSEDRGLIRYLLRNRHTSPFEGVTFKFHVKAPIFIFRQWHRHRTWSYNEYSGRYSVMSDECYVPNSEHITFQDPDNKQGGTNATLTGSEEYKEDVELMQSAIREQYDQFIDSGMRRELARINLPLAQYSEMYAVVNLHNLLHFMRLRLDSHAQYEIRVYAQALYDLISPIVPITCEAFDEYSMNSMNLTGRDVSAIKELLSEVLGGSYVKQWTNNTIKETANKHFDNSREKKEFLNKVNTFINDIDFLEVSDEES